MASFKIDLSTAVVFVATEPQPKLVNRQTGEVATDRESGVQLMTVGLLVSDEGQGDLYQVAVPQSGIPEGLTPGTPVAVTGLRARDWENTFNGEKRHGISFRAVAVTSLTSTQAGGLITMAVLIALVIAVALVAGGGLVVRRRFPAAFWLLAGLPVAWIRFRLTYASTMEACGLVVNPSRLRAFVVRHVAKGRPEPVPPRVRRVRGTLTGMRVRLRLPAGLEPADVAAASERLRHAWGVHAVHVAEVKPGTVELRMTGYDVLRHVRMPARELPAGRLAVPAALRDDGTVFVRDYTQIPHALTLGANQSGKSMYQRNLIKELAKLPVALVGIDCKHGVEQSRFAPRLSALATNPDQASALLEGLESEMQDRFALLELHQVSNIWDLPASLRPTPIVVIIDEIAELFLVTSKKDEERRDLTVTRLVSLAQMARAIGIYLEVCGQRFGAELGKGATMLRAQLTGRVVHRVNDKQTAEMGLGDIAPEAVMAATAIAPDRPGTAVAGDTSGGWSRIRTSEITLTEAAEVCREHAHLTPELPVLAAFRPYVPAIAEPADAVPPVEPVPG